LKFAVLGAAGQLGRDLCPRLPGDVVPLARDKADLSKPVDLRMHLTAVKPDVVINCAAYNFVDRAETEPQACFAVNAWGSRELALICRDLDVLLVHFSTDYVFGLDESRRTPYHEGDAPGPLSVYGLSKLAGEYLVRALWPKHIVIRTCGLYGVWGSGGKGGNFVETMLRVAAQGKPLRVVGDQTCTPSYTVDVATSAVALIGAGRAGLYHLTNSGSCTWFEFAQAIFRLAAIRADLSPTTSLDYAAPARRPPYSVLAPSAYNSLGLPAIRPWEQALTSYLAERAAVRK
jgi:dTDP-4-dehydrorhamnose reductase